MKNLTAEELKTAAAEFCDHLAIAQTAESMGAVATAEAERQAAADVRQGVFGPDSQFNR